jgi:4-hydroxy-tetrahydrodipicolinate reductase
VCAGLAAQDDIELAGGFGRHGAGEPLVELLGLQKRAGLLYASLDELFEEERPDAIVDFTLHPVTLEVARAAVERGVHPVIGATGWTDAETGGLREQCARARLGAVLAPNFAVGAILMMRFAEEAARFFEREEIVEMHHDRKRDAPSGTAKLTAHRIESAAGRAAPIHSIRLPGLVAHQAVIFGALGETLTIRHDSLGRESFVRGVLAALRRVQSLNGLVVGLDSLLEQPA